MVVTPVLVVGPDIDQLFKFPAIAHGHHLCQLIFVTLNTLMTHASHLTCHSNIPVVYPLLD